MAPPLELRLGDVLRLRKPHPCGNEDFEVVRLGADIGLKCTLCGRRILLPRSTLELRIVEFVHRADAPGLPADLGPSPSSESTGRLDSDATDATARTPRERRSE